MMLLVALLAGLIWMIPADAAIFTVGSGGTHTTVQEAIDAALAVPGSDEIRIATGTFFENLDITPTGSGNILEISGGWNATFASRGDVRSVIDGGMSNRVANINLDTGDGLVFENLKFQNGNANPAAGLLVTQFGDSIVRISDCEISNNVAESDRSESGGLRVSVNEESTFSLLDSRIADNQSICTGTIDCREGGMGLQAAGNSEVTVSRNDFVNNSVTIGEGSAFAGGAYIGAYDSSVLIVEDNQFIDNSVTGTSNSGIGIGLALEGDGTKTARRNRVEGNIATAPFPENMVQLSIFQWGDQSGILSDSVIVKSNTKGVTASTSGDGNPNLYLVNLTVADHASRGIQFNKFAAGGVADLSNSIAVDNGENASLGEGVTSSNNLLSGSAGFVNADSGNYTLSPSSVAINAGTNAPPGGLGPTDFAGNDRISESTVDIGAYEFQSDVTFADGFESL